MHSFKILLLISLYSLAFTLLLCGLRMLRLEHLAASSVSRLANASAQITSVESGQKISDSISLHSSQRTSDLTAVDSQKISGLTAINSQQVLQKNIASQIIRLHVIANSDRQSDQRLKLKVRDAIIQDMQSTLKNASSIEDARSILTEKMPQIQKKAQETIQAEGYDYPVSISLNKRYFPVKVYGDLTFPAGEYEALCLEIGEAAGRNWWCVLFPSLCFVDETYAVVPDESKEKLQDSLSEEEYASLENQGNSREMNDNENKDSDETGEEKKVNSEETVAEENTDSEKEDAKNEQNRNKLHFRSGFLDWIMNR